jgi:lysine biosynthesis protein LysW
MAVTCPECDADLDVDEFDVEEDEEVSCPECGQTLRVVTVSPLELEPVDDEDEEEDEDDDENGEEEELEDDDTADEEEDEGDWEDE